MGWHGYTLVRDQRANIDQAAAWYGVALVLVAYFAWNGARPAPRSWSPRASAYLRAHPIELALLGLVVLVGVATRLYLYGTLPPDGFVTLEEHINGGVAWDILQGDRPYIYPIPRYLNALSIWLLGPTTDGLRAHSVVAGIITVPFFYFMMREAVSRPGALFATGLFAASRVLGDVTVHYQTLILAEVLMIWMMLRAINTGSLLWLVPSAALAAILSYEYETAKALPLFVIPFLGWLGMRALVWPRPQSLRAAGRRVTGSAPLMLKGAIVVGAVVLILLGPMVADAKRGRDIYFASLDRNQADRGGGTFAPDWESQLESSIQVFTPWIDPDFNVIGSIASGGAIDDVTSIVLWASAICGVIFFWRGHRALFIGWLLGGIIMSSLLLSNWAPWKVIGWLPPAIALSGFLADDILVMARRFGSRVVLVSSVAMAAIVAAAFLLNMRTLHENAHATGVLKEWGNNPSYNYAICDKLQKRPDDTFGIVSQRQRSIWGFGADVVTIEDAKKLWGDFRFVCDGLVGISVPSLQEAWPLVVTEDRPYAFIQPANPGEDDQIVNTFARALPELGEPDERVTSPGGTFELLIYDATRDEINARRGLVLQWLDDAGSPIDDPIISSTFDAAPPTGAAQFSITGLISTSERFNGFLGPVEQARGLTIAAEKQPLYANGAGITATIGPGWHLVDIRGNITDGVPARYAWFAADGSVFDVQPDAMFALEDQDVWLHLRELQPEQGAPFVVIRYDFEPHASATNGVRIDASTPAPAGARVLRDYYRGYWTLATADRFTFQSSTGDQSIEVKIDGETVIYRTPSEGTPVGSVQLGPGEHLIEVTYSEPTAAYTGGFIWATSATTGEVVPIRVRPFTAVPSP